MGQLVPRYASVMLLGRGPGPERNEVLVNSVWVDPGGAVQVECSRPIA
jgi:hypothetical protein